MPSKDTLEEAKAGIESLRQAMHAKFKDNRSRLGQLDSSLATASMAVEHLFDEDLRHQDLRDRVAKAINEGDEDVINRHRHQLAAIGRKEA